MIILQIDQIYQGYLTIIYNEQTNEMIISKKLDAITRSIPSMILQLYCLLKTLSLQTNNNIIIILLSINSSIIGASFTLASLSSNSGISIFNKYYINHIIYYCIELTSRVIIISIIFYTINGYGIIIICIDFLLRLYYGYYINNIDQLNNTLIENIRYFIIHANILNSILLAIQSFGSDHTYVGENNKMLYIGFSINTIEMFIFLIILNFLKTPDLIVSKEKGFNNALTVIACITWVIRLLYYALGILDIIPIEEGMASKEETNSKSASTITITDKSTSNDEVMEKGRGSTTTDVSLRIK
jgi:hypothetical protein